MKIYFNNSYEMSQVGFQLSYCDTSDGILKYAETSVCGTIKQFLESSGSVCIIGKSNNILYAVFKGISVEDTAGRRWYINMAVEDNHPSVKFTKAVYNILLRYRELCDTLKECFTVANNRGLSYDLSFEKLIHFMNAPVSSELTSTEIFSYPHAYIYKYKKFLQSLKHFDNRLYLVVPESTLSYFYAQNRAFQRVKPEFVIPANVFDIIINNRIDELENVQYEESVNSTENYRMYSARKNGMKIHDNQLLRYAAGAAITVGALCFAGSDAGRRY